MIRWLFENRVWVAYAVVFVLSVWGLFWLRKRPQTGMDIAAVERRRRR